MAIVYLNGDATYPKEPGPKILAHVCNDVGVWGKGFVLAVSERWSMPELEYRKLRFPGNLGTVQYVPVEKDIVVANMIAQNRTRGTGTRWRKEDLRTCLIDLNIKARELRATIHMPRIGTGLGGGKWSDVEGLLKECLHTPVYVYTYSQGG